MEQSLFSEHERTDDRPKRQGEHPYDYLDLSAREECNDIRLFLNNAFSHLPVSEKTKMKEKIKIPDIIHSDAAIFELIMHELLLKAGCKVKIHPALEKSSEKPDFLVTTEDGEMFYLEAKLVSELNDDTQSKKTEKNRLYDKVNEKFSGTEDATLSINILNQSTKSPSLGKLCRDIKSKIPSLNENNLTISWMWISEKNDWIVELTLEHRDKWKGRFITAIDMNIEEITVTETITKKIKDKARKYKKLDSPYIIAININSEFNKKEDEIEALYGRVTMTYSKKGNKCGDSIQREGDSVWIGPQRRSAHNKKVSAVWCFDNVSPWRLLKRHTLYLNPYATKPLSQKFYEKFPHAILDTSIDKLDWIDGPTLLDIFKLDWKWPTKSYTAYIDTD